MDPHTRIESLSDFSMIVRLSCCGPMTDITPPNRTILHYQGRFNICTPWNRSVEMACDWRYVKPLQSFDSRALAQCRSTNTAAANANTASKRCCVALPTPECWPAPNAAGRITNGSSACSRRPKAASDRSPIRAVVGVAAIRMVPVRAWVELDEQSASGKFTLAGSDRRNPGLADSRVGPYLLGP